MSIAGGDDSATLEATTRAELHRLFLEDGRPWVVAFSGGKDSTLVLQLVYAMLLGLGPRAHKPVFVVTAAERPCKTLQDRVVIEDLHATLYTALGISPKLAYEIEKRPFYVTRDASGQPVTQVLA